MAFSTYLANALLSHTLNLTTYAKPTPYVALTTVSNAATATEAAYTGAESSGGSYARQLLTSGAPASKSAANSNALTFTNLAASTLTGVMIFDAPTGGNLLYYGPLSASAAIAAGGGYQLPIGSLTETLA